MPTIKIKDNDDFVRDIASKGVIMTNRSHMESYNAQKEMARKRLSDEKQMKDQINTLMKKVSELSGIVEKIKS